MRVDHLRQSGIRRIELDIFAISTKPGRTAKIILRARAANALLLCAKVLRLSLADRGRQSGTNDIVSLATVGQSPQYGYKRVTYA